MTRGFRMGRVGLSASGFALTIGDAVAGAGASVVKDASLESMLAMDDLMRKVAIFTNIDMSVNKMTKVKWNWGGSTRRDALTK